MNLRSFFLFFILILSVYQDFPLVNVFGEIARSPIVFLTPLLLLYLLKNSKIQISVYTKYLIFYILYLIIITIIYLLWIFITKQQLFFLGENIVTKSMKMAVYPLTILIYYQFIYTFLNKDTTRFETLFKSMLALEIFLIIYLVFETYYSKTLEIFMPYLHSNEDKYWRIRLLSLEESWVGSIITIVTFTTIYLSIYLNKHNKTKLFVLSLSIFFILYYTIRSESKGYMLIFLLSTLPLVIKYFYNNKKIRKFLFLGTTVLVIFGFYVFSILYDTILSQLYYSITFGTRFSSYLACLNNFVYNPFGVGWGPYLNYYLESLTSVVESSTMSSFELREVKGYLTTTKNLSSKTYFFDNLVFGGIFFLLFFYLFFLKRYFIFSKIKSSSLAFIRIPLLYIILSSIVYVTFAIKYEIWFFLAFIDVLGAKLKSEKK
ncbi:MAG: hypothetical protein P8P50_05460 [Flavobacteriaceae bacterium]|jgi:hypothetical protein|nr:hypothetical protein [Flavobacteriaceae bacterium]